MTRARYLLSLPGRTGTTASASRGLIQNTELPEERSAVTRHRVAGLNSPVGRYPVLNSEVADLALPPLEVREKITVNALPVQTLHPLPPTVP